MSLSVKQQEFLLLYVSYFFFLLSALLHTRATLIIGYACNLMVILMMFCYLVPNIQRLNGRISLQNLLLFTVTGLFIIPIAILRADTYSVLFFIKVIVFVVFFKITKLNINDFCKFANVTYLIYCILSVLFFFNLIPFSIYEKWDHPTMYIDLKLIKYYVFYGMEGGASYMDSYSGVILMLNVFLNKASVRKYFILLSIFFIMYTLRMTPLAGLIFSFMGYYVVRNRVSAIVFLLVGNLFFGISLYWLVTEAEPLGIGIPFSDLMYVATHARSMIWQQQIEIMLKEYNIVNYLLGGYDVKTFSIPAVQIWGQSTGDFYDNPHNSYLLLFFRSPFLFIIYYLSFLYCIYRSFDRRAFVVLLFISIICYTNSTIIGLQNPIYIYVVLFLLVRNKKNDDENTLLASGI